MLLEKFFNYQVFFTDYPPKILDTPLPAVTRHAYFIIIRVYIVRVKVLLLFTHIVMPISLVRCETGSFKRRTTCGAADDTHVRFYTALGSTIRAVWFALYSSAVSPNTSKCVRGKLKYLSNALNNLQSPSHDLLYSEF